MRISARCDYACRALLELALHWPEKRPLQIQQISERQGIPERYLVQILLQLKNQGLINSIRGKEGGYNLAKAPERISLGEVIRTMSGPLLPRAGKVSKSNSIFVGIWNDTEKAMSQVLDSVTFEDVCKKAQGVDDAIVYQI